MTQSFKRNTLIAIALAAIFVVWVLFVPSKFGSVPLQKYTVQKGMGYQEISAGLTGRGIITNPWFFDVYVILSGQHGRLQAGTYEFSASMPLYQIVGKLVSGDVVKNTITVIEGWTTKDIAAYLNSKEGWSSTDFLALTKKDYRGQFDFLKDKPVSQNLEGYLFPDTYQLSLKPNLQEAVDDMLNNFGQKLTPDLRKEITAQHKSIFQIVTMASIIEKEVQSPEDKKIVSGILWKRIANNMPLQVDSTVNFITGKSDGILSLKESQANSPYNTYKFIGLPQGPICNPGMDSILAAIYPTKTDYWYYLSADHTGKTIFSKTLDEQNIAIAKYLKP